MTTDAQRRAIKKYNAEKLDHVHLRMKKGRRAEIEQHLIEQRRSNGRKESLNAFINRAIDEAMASDAAKE